MAADYEAMRSILKYVSGETERVCRLCLTSKPNIYMYDIGELMILDKYNEELTLEDMMIQLGATFDESMPKQLCAKCARDTITAFTFLRRCDDVNNKWVNTLEKFQDSIDQIDSQLKPSAKAIFLLIDEGKGQMYSTIKKPFDNDKESVAKKFSDMMRTRQLYDKKKLENEINPKLYHCDQCDISKKSYMALVTHVERIHRKSNHPCPKCNKGFPTKPLLKMHIERRHFPKTIQCNQCPKMFGTDKLLKVHIYHYHTSGMCKICLMEFPTKKLLAAHMDKHGSHECSDCGKKFNSTFSYKDHIKICNKIPGAMNVFCDICKKGYLRKTSLRTHLAVEHGFGKVWHCMWCNKQFGSISRLELHTVKHTKIKAFTCEVCGCDFTAKNALKHHLNMHTGERPYPCEYCEEKFISASRKMEHMRRKHLGPDKKCDVCEAKFHTNFELNNHVSRHYNPKSKLYAPTHAAAKALQMIKEE